MGGEEAAVGEGAPIAYGADIAEVALPIEFRLRNIEATEAAQRALQERGGGQRPEDIGKVVVDAGCAVLGGRLVLMDMLRVPYYTFYSRECDDQLLPSPAGARHRDARPRGEARRCVPRLTVPIYFCGHTDRVTSNQMHPLRRRLPAAGRGGTEGPRRHDGRHGVQSLPQARPPMMRD